MKIELGKKLQKLTRGQFLLPVALAAMLLLVLLPRSGREKTEEQALSAAVPEAQDLTLFETERRLEQALSLIEGAGRVRVLLAISAGEERVLALKGDEPAVISSGSGKEETVELYRKSARYLGAVVISEGAASANVRLALTDAVGTFTGLGSDKITILEMDPSGGEP